MELSLTLCSYSKVRLIHRQTTILGTYMPKINTKYCGLHINFATYMKQEVVFKKLRTFSLAIDDAILSLLKPPRRIV